MPMVDFACPTLFLLAKVRLWSMLKRKFSASSPFIIVLFDQRTYVHLTFKTKLWRLHYGYDDCAITFYDVRERTVLQDVVDTKRANEKQSGDQSLWKMRQI